MIKKRDSDHERTNGGRSGPAPAVSCRVRSLFVTTVKMFLYAKKWGAMRSKTTGSSVFIIALALFDGYKYNYMGKT